jgi:hypothetical protein
VVNGSPVVITDASALEAAANLANETHASGEVFVFDQDFPLEDSTFLLRLLGMCVIQ